MLPGPEEKAQTSEQVGKKKKERWAGSAFLSRPLFPSLHIVPLFHQTKLMLIRVEAKQVMKSGCCRSRLLERVLRVGLLSEVAKNNSS